MPFTNPAIAGDEIIYPVRVSGPQGSFENLSANNTFLYKGTELATLFAKGAEGNSAVPRGINCFASFTPTMGLTTTTEVALGYLDFTAITNRLYKVRTGVMSNSAAGTFAEFRIRTTGDGSTPTITSGQLCTSYRTGQYGQGYCDELISIGSATSRKIRMILTMGAASGTPALLYYGQIRLFVEDMGGLIVATGTATPAVPSNYHTFDIQPYASRSYAETPNMSIAGWDNLYMSQGDLHDGLGNRRSWCWFDRNTAGGGLAGSLTDLVGVAKANVEYCQLYLYYPHWYYATIYGGSPPHNLQKCVFGWHNQTAVPGGTAEVAGGFPNLYYIPWNGRNTGAWIDIKGTTLLDAMLAGSFNGIVLGNTGTADFEEYGYAYGANGVGGQMPGLKCAYYK